MGHALMDICDMGAQNVLLTLEATARCSATGCTYGRRPRQRSRFSRRSARATRRWVPFSACGVAIAGRGACPETGDGDGPTWP